jgi:signal transduction histidine kinase
MTISHGLGEAGERPRRSWLAGRPYWFQAVLDGLGLLLGLAVVAQLGDPDVLLHVAFVVLAVEAFAFGLRVVAVRIAFATIFIVAYAQAAASGLTWAGVPIRQLELSEWPLMIMISATVAILADRVTQTGRHYAALFRQASTRLLTAQEDERSRLARDLHDGVGQTLTALAAMLDIAGAALPPDASTDRSDARSMIARARDLAGAAIDETRLVAFHLMPPRLTELGLAAAIRNLATMSAPSVEVDINADLLRPGLIGSQVELEAYRIVQEALANAMRHAHASHIRIAAGRSERTMLVVVHDDGIGFRPGRARDRGLGMAGMLDRAASIGARLRIDSSPGSGTRVHLAIPLPPEAWSTGATDTVDAMTARVNP